MWKDPEPDPGGDTQEGSSSGKSPQEVLDLKDQNEQQQLLIAQLKEMLRKEQSNVTQEKVDEYINTLSKAKAKKSRTKKDESSLGKSASTSSIVDVTKKQKLNLLRQQLEENKARLAERGKSQKGIEEMVIQLKAQLNDSQQLIPPHLSIIESKNLEYSKNSSQEELYNILLTKERKITDLLNKVQKQEVTILDLEENLKEKDSVIDARTKAITLMTDSLSKKGKSTLDALDDTKEQMRKMQENFITLESEMKARQVKLLNDLKAKNFEIAELQENNQKLLEENEAYFKTLENYKNNESGDSKDIIRNLQEQLNQTLTENEAHTKKISELEKKLQDSEDDLNRLKSIGVSVCSEQNQDEEIAKLKKQLEEANKSMIKVKAQSKSKIKELNKKLDQIKKVSDANALIVQLQNENTKLSEKIAELEEEKGNIQLKMVESSDSIKDSSQLEELEIKIRQNSEELEEKDKIITLLETEILSLKEEASSLDEKISSLSHLENMQVSTEIRGIQLEEQLEKVENENLKLKEEIEELLRKKEEMTEYIEELKKEKQDISTKLDNYIQENMELIDKLEKLSAEKVSSAESIEIVEGLTQQEKLELAAYQKNLDDHIEAEPLKCSEDEPIEPPTELNESVLQLSEDSSELLQKIDMFNMERKEVMTKMDALKDENAQLNMKLKEIENNRDILAETYEQLQTEKEMLQTEKDELLRKLEETQQHSEAGSGKGVDSGSVHINLEKLQEEYEKLLTENKNLKSNLKEFDKTVHEKHNLDLELKHAKEKLEEFQTKIRDDMEEISNYQTVIEENKNELINSANLINDLQTKLTAREKDITDLNVIINDLNEVVKNLEAENAKLGNFEVMETQVKELKTALDDQIQQAQEYEEEIAQNNNIITDLNTKLIEMNKRMIETEHDIEMKCIEFKKLAEDLKIKDEIIRDLQQQVQEKDNKVGAIIQEMKEKYLSLQKQLDGNNGSLEAKIVELTNKNKEQMDKMKKIAANLKKKSQAYQELEGKYNQHKEKWEMEINEKDSIISNSQDKIATIQQQLKELEEEINIKNARIANSETKIKVLNEVIESLEQSKAELQNYVIELKHREQKLTEVSLKQELSTSLHEEFDNIPSNQDSAKEEKIKELELIIETNEADLAHFNERIHKLEERIAQLEQEKETLIQKTAELSDQLNLTSKSVEEKSFLEEKLGQKLLQVTENDEVLVKKLEEVTEENREFIQKNKELEEMNLKLKMKLKKAHERVTQLKTLQTSMEELENVNSELKKQLAILEANQKHIQDENLELQKQNQNDYEKIEADYQVQLEELVGCRNELTVECEKLRESLKDREQREEDLLSEIKEYKQKMEEINDGNKEKLEELGDELRVSTFNWKESVKEIEVLNEQIEFLRKELINKIARETVETIVTEAESRVRSMRTIGSQTEAPVHPVQESTMEPISVSSSGNKSENDPPEIVPTFHWSDGQPIQPTSDSKDWFVNRTATDPNIQPAAGYDWFSNSSQTANIPPNPSQPGPQQPTTVDNSREELLNKIKALEFLLYNIDKEKEEAFEECTGMVIELTRLLYEKVNKDVSSAAKPKTDHPLSEIESQIMSETDITDAALNKKELQNIEFEKADASFGEQNHPIVEDVVQPKRAYLTYQPEDKVPVVKPELFGENDDGWGWGPEEAKLEEEHQFRTESEPQVQNLRNEIARLNETLQVLQMERENHLEEIKQLQVKSGKLIKKCKELKHKNDQLMEKQQNKKSEGADFLDLDAAIQEELKMQIAQLEKKIKEISNELEKEKHEKSNILKRVDVLTSANDRMTEMKEIQDTEVFRWKRKYQEAEEKLQQYEWGSDGFNEGSKLKENSDIQPSSSKDASKIEELQQTIRELSLDNDELQALLEEQRQLRMDLEKAKSTFDSGKKDFDNLELENKIKHFEQELVLKTEEMQRIINERNDIYLQLEELQKAIKEKEESIQQLQENLSSALQTNNEFEKLVKDLQENEKGHMEQDALAEKVKELEAELWQLNQWKAQHNELLQEKERAFNELILSLEQVNMLKEELNIQVKQLTNDLDQHRHKYDELQVESSRNILELQQEITAERKIFDGLKAQLDEKMNTLLTDLEEHKQINDQLQSEHATKVTQLSQELQVQTQKYQELQGEFTKKVAEVTTLAQELQNKRDDYSVKDSFEWAQEKYQLESSLMEKEAVIVELRNQKEILEKEIDVLKNNLELKQREYDQVLAETEEKISRTAKELEDSWIIQVDQRGADVAESWKLHLESVEAEFASVQEKLKYEINELEEKCNALVNENNELRKNVDAEIRNEVDRISALSQQISDGQRFITELNNKVMEKQSENESLMDKFRAVDSEKDQILKDLRDKEAKLSSLSIIVDTTQKQFDEKREVVEEIVRILEKNTNFPISFEKEDVLNEFQRQLNLLSVKEQEIFKLNQTIGSLQDQLGSVQNKEGEIFRLNQLVQDLQKQLDLLPEKDNEIFKLNKLVEESQKQLVLLQEKDEEILNLNRLVEDLQQQLPLINEKDSEISRMRNLIADLQGQLSLLQERDEEIARLNQIVESYKVQQDGNHQELDKYRQEYTNANMALESYKQRLDEFSTSYMTLQNSLEEKNQLIATLNQQLQLTEGLKNDNNKDVEKLHEEISQLKQDCSMLQQSLADCQEQLFNVTNELTNKTNQLESVNQQLTYSQQNFEIQEAELNNLKLLLQSKEEEYNSSVENLRRTHLRDLENHYEELLAAKDLDIETIRSQLNESIQNSNQLAEKLNVEETVRKQLEDKVKVLEDKIAEQNTLAAEEDHQLSEMRSIIEQQVIKIEELKKELFAKSSDYDSLIAEMDIGRKAITQQPTTSVVEKPSSTERPQLSEEDLSEPVSRAELDLALYMLHQRDVRCEELTVELTQLLEERDTLQLRLSNALREKEDIRRKLVGTEEMPSTFTASPATPLSKSSTIFLAASGTELATEPLETSSEVQNLESKLSELKKVGYKKDKTFVDEQEFRRHQQMSIMQQHINEASKLPPEAAAKLVDASYTLSRDVQSPSKVLLNWLWGRSTPKVNDT